jgi:hypothetical protein
VSRWLGRIGMLVWEGLILFGWATFPVAPPISLSVPNAWRRAGWRPADSGESR